MTTRLMLLHSQDPEKTRLVTVPEDFEEHEAFRHVTGLIAEVQEDNPEWDWEDLLEALEPHGFAPVEFMAGPSLD